MATYNKNNIDNQDIIKAHQYSSNNIKILQNDNKCGCFYCLKIFSPKEIKEYLENEGTAICPYCGIDSIIGESSGYPITKYFLEAMYHYWFDNDT